MLGDIADLTDSLLARTEVDLCRELVTRVVVCFRTASLRHSFCMQASDEISRQKPLRLTAITSSQQASDKWVPRAGLIHPSI